MHTGAPAGSVGGQDPPASDRPASQPPSRRSGSAGRGPAVPSATRRHNRPCQRPRIEPARAANRHNIRSVLPGRAAHSLQTMRNRCHSSGPAAAQICDRSSGDRSGCHGDGRLMGPGKPASPATNAPAAPVGGSSMRSTKRQRPARRTARRRALSWRARAYSFRQGLPPAETEPGASASGMPCWCCWPWRSLAGLVLVEPAMPPPPPLAALVLPRAGLTMSKKDPRPDAAGVGRAAGAVVASGASAAPRRILLNQLARAAVSASDSVDLSLAFSRSAIASRLCIAAASCDAVASCTFARVSSFSSSCTVAKLMAGHCAPMQGLPRSKTDCRTAQ